MTNIPHAEPVVCPHCGELIITALGESVLVAPRHPDRLWPQTDCVVSDRQIAVRTILR